MSPEEAYDEALRRIREVEETGELALDLSSLALNRLPQELKRLTSLQSLALYMCWNLSDDLTPLARLTSLQSLNLTGCWNLSGDLSPLAGLTSLQWLSLSDCHRLIGDLSPLVSLTSLQSLNLTGCGQFSALTSLSRLTSLQKLELSGCHQLSNLSPLASLTSLQSLKLDGCKQLRDISPLAGLTKLHTLDLSHCHGVRRFAPLESLLPTLKELYLFGCKFEDSPAELCGEREGENVLDIARAHYDALQQIFVSYAWRNIAPHASEEDRQRQEVVERLCQTLEKEHRKVIRDKNALNYGDLISTFMKTLGKARLVIVVLSAKYLRSPYCMTELHALYKNTRQEKQEFLNRIIPLVLEDARIGTPEERVEHAKHWGTRYLKLKADLDYL
jgi:Leucine-rich repeat (LRR) protein